MYDQSSEKMYVQHEDEYITITGMSGRLPESSNIEEFKENLLNGIDMVTEDERRWPVNKQNSSLSCRFGKIKDLESFDASFFQMSEEAHMKDPQLRMLLEVTYEAIVDAGVNPTTLTLSRTGVFVSVNPENGKLYTETPSYANEFRCYGSMLANNISSVFKFTGPNYGTTCSLFALHQAVTAIRTGKCDAAIVAGSNLILEPLNSLYLESAQILSKDGKCKVFDSTYDGYVRAEAVVAIYLQKKKDARRVYATVIRTKTNTNDCTLEYSGASNRKMLNKLIREIYNEAEINRADVVYVEAHGIDTVDEEIKSINEMFCQDRTKENPLYIGSVKSNMGHAEAVSGLCSVIKVLIAMETNRIPANLHFNTPNSNISECNGRLQVVAEHMSWNGGFVGINAFGSSDNNVHVILRSNSKSPPSKSPVDDILNMLKMLLVVSGRTEEAVHVLLDNAKKHKDDKEFISLLHAVHANNIPGHIIRGYEILQCDNTRKLTGLRNNDMKRPIWFIFSGLGSQRPSISSELLFIEPFRKSLRQCEDILKPIGIDLEREILYEDKETSRNVVSNLSIVAVQIILVDLLKSMGIFPDGMIGYSIGELCCAYCDCEEFTLEKTILAAYLSISTIEHAVKEAKNSNLLSNTMVKICLAWEEVEKKCSGIEHNISSYITCRSKDSFTISGPFQPVQQFVEKCRKIFGKETAVQEINSCSVAFHDKNLAQIESQLIAAIEKIITKPKPRSSKWISGSINPTNTGENQRRHLNSAEYHAKNMLSPILFRETITRIPNNAIIIDMASHLWSYDIVRELLPKTVTKINLQNHYNANQATNVINLSSEIGKLYMAGIQLDISKLYTSISFPVSRGRPMIGHLIRWDHSIWWNVPRYEMEQWSKYIEIDLSNISHVSMGYKINGEMIFPQTTCLYLVWKAFASKWNTTLDQWPVVFKHVRFQHIIFMSRKKWIKLIISISKNTGAFEIFEGDKSVGMIASGYIYAVFIEQYKFTSPLVNKFDSSIVEDYFEINEKDIYKELYLRGYEYSNVFRCIKFYYNGGYYYSELTWLGDWISYINSIFQFNNLMFSKPQYISYIQELVINPFQHKLELLQNSSLPIYRYQYFGISSSSIQIKGLETLTPWWQKPQSNIKYEQYHFVPYEFGPNDIPNNRQDSENSQKHNTALTVLLQIMCENLTTYKIKIVEVADKRAKESLLGPLVRNILLSLEPSITINLTVTIASFNDYMKLSEKDLKCKIATTDASKVPPGENAHLVIAADVLSNHSDIVLRNLINALSPEGFILLEETAEQEKLLDISSYTNVVLVAKYIDAKRTYILLKQKEKNKNKKKNKNKVKNIFITNDVKDWFKDLKAYEKYQNVLLICHNRENEEDRVKFNNNTVIIGLLNCIRKEYRTVKTRYIYDQIHTKPLNPAMTLENDFYKNQLCKELVANVYKNDKWGSYRYLPLDVVRSKFSVAHAYVGTAMENNLHKLIWIESPLKSYTLESNSDKIICMVYYAAINKEDVSLAKSTILPQGALKPTMDDHYDVIGPTLGYEFSGRDLTDHTRYMGIVKTGELASTVLADRNFLWDVPNKWTLKEAATIPIAYVVSYYALFVRGDLKSTDSILIHNGADHISQAAITIALHAGCTVFTTVYTQVQRQHIKRVFPKLTDEFIGYMQTFKRLILFKTAGYGVNSKVFSKNDLEEAFTCQAGQTDHCNHCDHYTKKVLLKIHDDEKSTESLDQVISAVRRVHMHPFKTYVIVGSLSEFGLELVNWLIIRGAKYILLSCPKTCSNYQKWREQHWRNNNVVIITDNAKTVSDVTKMIEESQLKLPPIGGIFNLAADFSDKTVKNLEEDDFKAVINYQKWREQHWRNNNVVIITDNAKTVSDVTKLLREESQLGLPPIGGIFNLAADFSDISDSDLEEDDFKAVMLTRNFDMLPDHYYSKLDYFIVFSSMIAGRDEENDNAITADTVQNISSCLEALDYFLQLETPCPVLSANLLNGVTTISMSSREQTTNINSQLCRSNPYNGIFVDIPSWQSST
nr:PREDICTED: fatty acid synthase-like [Linepithema humile]